MERTEHMERDEQDDEKSPAANEPLIAVLPKDHGSRVPGTFARRCEEAVARFRESMLLRPDHRAEADALARTAEAFTWFLMDPRPASPATPEEQLARFKTWLRENVKRGAPPEEDVTRRVSVFFAWVEEQKLVSLKL